jgi:hypothetical protein
MLGNSHTPAGALLCTAIHPHAHAIAAQLDRRVHAIALRPMPPPLCCAAATDAEATRSVDGDMSWAVMRGAPSARNQFLKLECSCAVVKNEPFLNCACDCWPVTIISFFTFSVTTTSR